VVEAGINVYKLKLKFPDRDIPAIILGESGPGRIREAISVSLPHSLMLPWAQDGRTKILVGGLGKSRSDKWRVFAEGENVETTEEEVLCLFRTKYGRDGHNHHTGDRAGWKCSTPECPNWGTEKIPPDLCTYCGMLNVEDGLIRYGPRIIFADFPGRILAKGVRAAGAAGRMGSGEELLAVMPRGVVFRTNCTGHLEGTSRRAHYYMWTGKELLSAAWDERIAGDLF
jgi:hypothetical protein